MSSDISIIIPARNRLWSLPKAIASCASTKLAIEIIVIDDASTDGTAAWLSRRSDVITVEGNGWGKPWGVNKALALSTGTYIRYLDSDDWLNHRANDVQYEIAERERADIVVAGYDHYENDRLVFSVPWIKSDDFIAQQLGESAGGYYASFLFRREFVRDIPHRTHFPASDFASRDDRCFLLEVALRRPHIAVCNTSAFCYRHHSRQRLQFQAGLRGVGTNIQHLYIYRQILRLLEEQGELTMRRKRAAIKVLWPLAHWIAYTHPDEASEVAAWIYRLDPDFQPPEMGTLGYLYRHLGFAITERILRFRRQVLSPYRGVRNVMKSGKGASAKWYLSLPQEPDHAA